MEVTIFFSSTGMLGISIEDEPVAIIKFLAVIFLSPSDEDIVIVLVSSKEALKCVSTFLTTDFEGGRHQRRVDKIACA